jgi:pimeloyl-ACP methyl ester carboxylesterase
MMEQPQLVRSWCVDVLGILHPDYVWHDAAQVWQTPGAGEENIAGMVATPTADMAAFYTSLGMTADVAQAVASEVGPVMGRCILELYRDAAQPALADTGRNIAAASARPGLMINAENDHYVGTDEQAQQVADAAGARVVKLAGVGHWWMCEDPAAGAEVLEEFWASVG